jgi:uncharacterized repeat protein (TIGR03943 family)
VSREIQGVFLTVAGAIMLRLALSAQYLNYVKPSLQPYLITAAVTVVILGFTSFLLDAVFPRARKDGAPAGDDHGPRAGWLLGLPMAVILLVPPPAFGSYAANRSGATVPKPASAGFAGLPPGDPVSLLVRDYAVRATWGHGRSLNGRTIRLTGFVTPQAGGGWYVTRATLTCCAADARAAKVQVDGARGDYPADAWVTVTGTWAPSTERDAAASVPRIRARSVASTSQPANPYE